MAKKTVAEAAAERAADAAARAAAIAEADAMNNAAPGDAILDAGPAPIEGDAMVGDEESFLAALRELDAGNDILWSVHKISGPQETQGFIEKLTSSQLDMQRFRDVYGPGEYKVIGKRGGYYVRGGYKQLKISNVGYKPPGERQTEADLLKSIEDREERRASQRAAATKEWAAILAPLAAPIIANLFSGKSQVTELVTALGALQGLQPKPEKSPDMMSQLDQLSGVLAKLKEMSGNDQSQTGATWIDLVRDAIQGAKPVLDGIAAKVVAGRVVPGVASPSVAPILIAPVSVPTLTPAASTSPGSPSSTPPSSPPPSSDPMMQLLVWLKATAEQLAVQASRDKDPEFYAEVVADNLPDGVTPAEILSHIGRPDWWPMFSNFAPAVAPYQGWFSRFRDAFVAILEEQVPKGAPKPAAPQGPDPVPDPESFE